MDKPSKITVARLAQRLGISETTIYLALSGRGERYRISKATIEKVKKASDELGYRPNLVARQLAGKGSNAIGVLINTEAIADVRLIQAMEMLAAKRRIRFIVGHAVGTHDQVREYLEDFEARGVDGVIAVFHNHPDYCEVVLPELERFKNVVFFEKPASAGNTKRATKCFVQPDYHQVGRLGVQHLIDRGRKNIALVFNNVIFPYAVQRWQAYAEALKAAGRELNPQLVWVMNEQPNVRWTDPFTPELALKAVDDLVIGHDVDGIVAVNDLYAARLLGALRQRGKRVPEDVAVVGCDNLEISTLTNPTLTTIDLDTDSGAAATMELMFALLDRRELSNEQRGVVIQPKLITREST